MDSTSHAPPLPVLGTLTKSFTKLLRLRRVPSVSSNTVLYKPKFLENRSDDSRKELEALVANIFASVSAVKAAYAQLQLAQAPYDPDLIQSADRVVVTELKRLSELKRSFFTRAELRRANKAQAELVAQVQEQRNLLKAYKITTAKLESELQSKDSETESLKTEFRSAQKRCRALDARLRPGRTLAGLDELHLSGVNPTHFLILLRSTVKSIRSFVKIMVDKMRSSHWDLEAAAGAIQPDLCRRNPDHSIFAFQSYVSRIMFSDFQQQDFGLGDQAPDRRQFFADFTELKFVNLKDCFEKNSRFAKFCRGKYLRLVHPKMEAFFFGNLQQREQVNSGRGLPETDFFTAFSEMARRVWLLHCLFFTFGPDEKGVIFEPRRGSRFSDVYMESVAEEEREDSGGGGWPTVGFTVFPGFRLRRTIIQCRVYLVNCNK